MKTIWPQTERTIFPTKISETISEQLFRKYYAPTVGMGSCSEKFLIDSRCRLPMSMEELKALSAIVIKENPGLFGPEKISTPDKARTAEKICPQIGGSGWKRWPGLDHWHVTDANGKTIFKTQNYGYVLRYIKLYLERH